MYKVFLKDIDNPNEYEELIRVFLKPSEYRIIQEISRNVGPEDTAPGVSDTGQDTILGIPDEVGERDLPPEQGGRMPVRGEDRKNRIKRYLFDRLCVLTGKQPAWGILTGVRPVRLFGILAEEERGEERAETILAERFRVSDDKIRLLSQIHRLQRKRFSAPLPEQIGIYIGIPFCPTRCHYCSFPANQVLRDQIAPYLTALHREIDFTARHMREKRWYAETIYIGGGTPTTLDADSLRRLLDHVNESFSDARTVEFTVEAGRPDTIDAEKMAVIRASGADRISINPQTMNPATLTRIGRRHDTGAVEQAFRLAAEAGIPVINADLIAGLPGETPEDFRHSLERVLSLGPENLTIHTLAVKRTSRLKEEDAEYSYRQAEVVAEMLKIAENRLVRTDWRPYYLYRQKQMAGNLENTGYARPGSEGVYNVRIMDDTQTILALGAGGSTKVYFPQENRIERIFNVSNYEIYIQRIEEMLMRKKTGVFDQF